MAATRTPLARGFPAGRPGVRLRTGFGLGMCGTCSLECESSGERRLRLRRDVASCERMAQRDCEGFDCGAAKVWVAVLCRLAVECRTRTL